MQDFLTALLTGAGDVTRYVTPGTQVSAVAPPPYRTVEVSDVALDRDLTAGGGTKSAPGGQLRALVSALASADSNQTISVQYALTLAARAGRWEVQAVDPAPAVAAMPSAGPAVPNAGAPAPAPSTAFR